MSKKGKLYLIVIAVDDEEKVLNLLCKALTEAIKEAKIYGFSNVEYALDFIIRNRCDIAFLDIEMPKMSGLDLARYIKIRCPQTHIVFVTENSSYAVEAVNHAYARGYLLKPATVDDIKNIVEYIYYREKCTKIKIQCFGNFEAFYNGKPIHFESPKAKELLALLIDRKGASMTTKEIAASIFADKPYDVKVSRFVGTAWSRLRRSLNKVGYADIVNGEFNSKYVIADKLDCDYYKLLRGDSESVYAYQGEYMSQYEWAEYTNGELYGRFFGGNYSNKYTFSNK